MKKPETLTPETLRELLGPKLAQGAKDHFNLSGSAKELAQSWLEYEPDLCRRLQVRGIDPGYFAYACEYMHLNKAL